MVADPHSMSRAIDQPLLVTSACFRAEFADGALIFILELSESLRLVVGGVKFIELREEFFEWDVAVAGRQNVFHDLGIGKASDSG